MREWDVPVVMSPDTPRELDAYARFLASDVLRNVASALTADAAAMMPPGAEVYTLRPPMRNLAVIGGAQTNDLARVTIAELFAHFHVPWDPEVKQATYGYEIHILGKTLAETLATSVAPPDEDQWQRRARENRRDCAREMRQLLHTKQATNGRMFACTQCNCFPMYANLRVSACCCAIFCDDHAPDDMPCPACAPAPAEHAAEIDHPDEEVRH